MMEHVHQRESTKPQQEPKPANTASSPYESSSNAGFAFSDTVHGLRSDGAQRTMVPVLHVLQGGMYTPGATKCNLMSTNTCSRGYGFSSASATSGLTGSTKRWDMHSMSSGEYKPDMARVLVTEHNHVSGWSEVLERLCGLDLISHYNDGACSLVLQDNSKVLTGQQYAQTWTQILVLLVRALAVPLHPIKVP